MNISVLSTFIPAHISSYHPPPFVLQEKDKSDASAMHRYVTGMTHVFPVFWKGRGCVNLVNKEKANLCGD